jgi:hypothetical protein
MQIQQLDDMLEDPEVAAEVLPTLGGINCLYLLQDMLEAGIRWVGGWVAHVQQLLVLHI